MKTRLGDRVKDKVTGFQGIATGRAEYVNGCRQYLVKPEQLEGGKYPDGIWLDEQYLLVVQPQVMADPFATAVAATQGGPDHRELPR